VNLRVHQHSVGELYGMVQQQALMVSMKEIYGWLALIGLFCLLIILLRESDIRPKNTIEPTYKVIRKTVMSTYKRFS
jgi:hypothetical protein